MKKKYIVIFIVVLFIVGVALYLFFPHPYIKPIKAEQNLEDFIIEESYVKLKNSSSNQIFYYKVKARKAKSFSIDVYKGDKNNLKATAQIFENFENLNKNNFQVGVGTISNTPVIKIDDSVHRIDEDRVWISENEKPVSGYHWLSQKYSPSKMNEPLILLTIYFSSTYSIHDNGSYYLKDFRPEDNFNYYIFTITFYDYDITKK
ncbi:hypothetical protein SAMN02745245_01280 [Anaerosphaera aminiphila DSM 21120]|uniref:Uncharacterized protein n=1 Tax=Anaerosphaera aminiphila DSM 21120 TaxID=1120995 RepID=A0A1M5SSX2_9FIRM|nr:hypothetical protein [Anaerosphaera aminiphila]SHH41537.1 hypothetical protein SAMN02745245_01280 [Anaerosphaera aminiphila DSM 21120]